MASIYNDCVLNVNSEAKVFEFWFPTATPPKMSEVAKQYDFVFYASILSETKGVEDAIEAFKHICRIYSQARFNIIGASNPTYMDYLIRKINKLGLTENIEFSGYFQNHEDMLRQVKKSKFALLPHKIDVIATTIREAMYLELPVVTYKTSGTPFLNKDKQAVLISEIGDIVDLAQNMLKLMSNIEFSHNLAKNAKSVAKKLFNNYDISKKLIEDNRAIVEHYHFNTPIPNKLLFHADNFSS